jgi:hypothetical protein
MGEERRDRKYGYSTIGTEDGEWWGGRLQNTIDNELQGFPIYPRLPSFTTSLILIKKQIKFFLIYKEILKLAVAKSYMTDSLLICILYKEKYLRISSYIRKPLLIYDFATAPL